MAEVAAPGIAGAEVGAAQGRKVGATNWSPQESKLMIEVAITLNISELTGEKDVVFKTLQTRMQQKSNGKYNRTPTALRDHLKEIIAFIKTTVREYSDYVRNEENQFQQQYEAAIANGAQDVADVGEIFPKMPKVKPTYLFPLPTLYSAVDDAEFVNEFGSYAKKVFEVLTTRWSPELKKNLGYNFKWWDEQTFVEAVFCLWKIINKPTDAARAAADGHQGKYRQEKEARSADIHEAKRKRELDEQADRETKERIVQATTVASESSISLVNNIARLVDLFQADAGRATLVGGVQQPHYMFATPPGAANPVVANNDVPEPAPIQRAELAQLVQEQVQPMIQPLSTQMGRIEAMLAQLAANIPPR